MQTLSQNDLHDPSRRRLSPAAPARTDERRASNVLQYVVCVSIREDLLTAGFPNISRNTYSWRVDICSTVRLQWPRAGRLAAQNTHSRFGSAAAVQLRSILLAPGTPEHVHSRGAQQNRKLYVTFYGQTGSSVRYALSKVIVIHSDGTHLARIKRL
jgi:hypothetical protein